MPTLSRALVLLFTVVSLAACIPSAPRVSHADRRAAALSRFGVGRGKHLFRGAARRRHLPRSGLIMKSPGCQNTGSDRQPDEMGVVARPELPFDPVVVVLDRLRAEVKGCRDGLGRHP